MNFTKYTQNFSVSNVGVKDKLSRRLKTHRAYYETENRKRNKSKLLL